MEDAFLEYNVYDQYNFRPNLHKRVYEISCKKLMIDENISFAIGLQSKFSIRLLFLIELRYYLIPHPNARLTF